jgi:hypothetical protein
MKNTWLETANFASWK